MTATDTTRRRAEPVPAPPTEQEPPPPFWASAGPPAARPPLPPAAVAIMRVALLCTLASVWFVSFALGIGGLQSTRDQQLRYEQLREHLALGTTPIGGVIRPGTPIVLLSAPHIGLRQAVVEGTASSDLAGGPGHRRDTPLPGQPGTSVVYGRAVAFGGPFQRITQLRGGDVITAITGQGSFEYQVVGVRHAGDPLPDPIGSDTGRLSLVSVEGASWREGWAPDQLVYVDALLKGKPQQAPAGRPTLVPRAETAMQGDPGAWVAVVLWLQVLIAGAGAAAWAQARWGSAQAWLSCSPVIIAGLWGASEGAIQLLPNVL